MVTADLFLAINNPYEVNEGLTFSFETIMTFHKEHQKKRTATVMAYYNEDLVNSFFDKLSAKLSDAINPKPTRCEGDTIKIEPKEPEK